MHCVHSIGYHVLSMCLETVEDSNFQNCSKGVDVRGALVPRALDAYQGTITEIWIYMEICTVWGDYDNVSDYFWVNFITTEPCSPKPWKSWLVRFLYGKSSLLWPNVSGQWIIWSPDSARFTVMYTWPLCRLTLTFKNGAWSAGQWSQWSPSHVRRWLSSLVGVGIARDS